MPVPSGEPWNRQWHLPEQPPIRGTHPGRAP